VELAEHLHRLLDVLEPAAAELGRLVDDGYWANWFCHVESHAAEHAVELDRATLTRLLRLPGDLWLDVSAEDDRPEALSLPDLTLQVSTSEEGPTGAS
jgi:hypothetical protein